MTLVEQALRRLHDRGDDPRLRHDAADRAYRAFTGPLRDLADLEFEPRGAGKCIAALVHGRRSRVRGLSAEGDQVTLDTERPEHDAERKVHRLEHRALLDVQLEVGGCALELGARVERRVEVDAVLA